MTMLTGRGFKNWPLSTNSNSPRSEIPIFKEKTTYGSSMRTKSTFCRMWLTPNRPRPSEFWASTATWRRTSKNGCNSSRKTIMNLNTKSKISWNTTSERLNSPKLKSANSMRQILTVSRTRCKTPMPTMRKKLKIWEICLKTPGKDWQGRCRTGWTSERTMSLDLLKLQSPTIRFNENSRMWCLREKRKSKFTLPRHL